MKSRNKTHKTIIYTIWKTKDNTPAWNIYLTYTKVIILYVLVAVHVC